VYHEDNALVGARLKAALDAGLTAILCVGERLVERKEGKTFLVVEEQLSVIEKAWEGRLDQIVVAYEPVWAIGTGVSSSPEQTKEVFDWLRTRLQKSIEGSDKVRILYGGSANGKNAKSYLDIRSVDGLLIGGAALKPEFADMVEKVGR
jgi:triosephosphate isomerase